MLIETRTMLGSHFDDLPLKNFQCLLNQRIVLKSSCLNGIRSDFDLAEGAALLFVVCDRSGAIATGARSGAPRASAGRLAGVSASMNFTWASAKPSSLSLV